tara:strand:- start:136 stop:741 length:606 start_codon:yes stop_codon:yes gene_type:complete
MAKKSTIPAAVSKRFEKPQYKVNDFVYMAFLGQKYYGYVKKIMDIDWGVCYLVEATNGTKYPCGLKYGEYTTSCRSGIIFYDETKQIGSDECKRRYNAEKGKVRSVSSNTGGTVIKNGNDNSTTQPIINGDINTVVPKPNTPSRKNDIKSSNKRVSDSSTKTRKHTSTAKKTAVAKKTPKKPATKKKTQPKSVLDKFTKKS